MNGFHDIEQLSAYLDGQLSPSDSARLESRLRSDPELASAYDDIRSARGILRKLPSRKAPRNFTLTRKMVGLKPPVPRSYFTFKFATTFATILFAVTVAVNSLSPRIAFVGVQNYGSGGGGCTGGCGGAGTVFDQPFAASEAVTDVPAATNAPVTEMLPAPTQQSAEESESAADAYNTERSTETPTTKEPAPETQSQPPAQPEPFLIPITWQIALFAVMIIGALGLFVMNQFAKRKWQ
jgi:anti-sigma factor RsiW